MALSLIQRLRFSPWFTQLVVIRKCNLHCGYCNEYDRHSPPVPLDVLKDRAAKLKALGAFSICFTGGEPTLHPDLPELIRYARHDLRFFRTSIITNGTYLTGQLVEGLNAAGLQAMQISIDGVKQNDTTVKVLDTLRKRLETLRTLAKFRVVVSGVVGACPAEETYEVIDYAKRMGFRPRVLLIHDARGQVKLSPEQMTVYNRIQKLIGRHLFELSDYRHRIITNGSAPFKCRAGSRYLYVDENGIVLWCSQTRKWFQKPLTEYTEEDLRQQFYTYKSCHAHCTLGCVRSASSVDNWRSQERPRRAAAADSALQGKRASVTVNPHG
ncbi:MAG: radical SAM protein [Deltaproteobacteria bacterium]|nr:radical SAM protein [Deltaproteobacteria bacterium]